MKKLVLLIVAAMTLTGAAAQFFSGDRLRFNESEALSKLRSAESIIENFYVDSVRSDTIVEEAIRAMLKTLDPHSSYSTAAETKDLEEPLQGNFSGIGISFNNPEDTLIVIQTTAGGPAERVGMLAGDRVIKVNDTIISGVKMPKRDIMSRIRGPKGSEVKISVERQGEPELIDFMIIRDDIPIYSVDAAYMVSPEIGYIRLSRFAEDTPAEIAEAMQRLSKEGMKHIIVDLQDNGGGYLVAATQLADFFLNKGDEVVFTQSSRTDPRYYITERKGPMTDGRVVVLVNQYSASASEILAGALQDNDRGVIVGRRTFGKGLVQRPFRFGDGSMMRLTIARYYTPSGRSIQKPYESYNDDMMQRLNSGELMNADSVHFDKTQLYHTRAGRPVYGGGGIMPDRFVALDTAFFTPYYRNLLAKSVIIKYTLKYVNNHRAALTADYPTEQAYLDGFTVSPEMLKELIDMGTADGVEFNQEQFDRSRDYLAAVIKAVIGRDLFEQATYWKVMNPTNPVYIEAVELISDPATYKNLLAKPKN